MKRFLNGNEAVAFGAYEGGVKVACAYPGTPSTDIIENFATFPEIYAEWSANEKAAIDTAMGASLVGVRCMVSMKHVGVNVALDALMQYANVGIRGGMMVVTCDDTGCHSSGSEQDNRYIAKFAKMPLLEPADAQEAKDFARLALQVSEDLDVPVMLRLTTRISHVSGVVEVSQQRYESQCVGFDENQEKMRFVGITALQQHWKRVAEYPQWMRYGAGLGINRIEWGDRRIGIITSGVAYQYIKEILGFASILKLGFTYPLDEEIVRQFASQVKDLYVVEELEPFLEEQLRFMGIPVKGKEIVPRAGEFCPEVIEASFARVLPRDSYQEFWERVYLPVESLQQLEKAAVPRPPVFCSGCPHRGIMHILGKTDAIIAGDIGCYSLGLQPPLRGMDSAYCMGAAVGNAVGIDKGICNEHRKPIIAVLGDSTFIHAGISPLAGAIYNDANITLIILDNSVTAMTGLQEHPGTGVTLQKKVTQKINYADICHGMGIEKVSIIDPLDLEAVQAALSEHMDYPSVSVIIAQRPCVFRTKRSTPFKVDASKCNGCKRCFQIACPALKAYPAVRVVRGKEVQVMKAEIDSLQCFGCPLCSQVCQNEAILPSETLMAGTYGSSWASEAKPDYSV